MAPASIVLEDVSKTYRGGGGIQNVNLEVHAGEVFGFLGPNGAGKSTTIRLLLDLIRPDEGRITALGLDARRDAVALHRRLGYLPGELSLYERLSARELLTHFAHLRGHEGEGLFSGLAERLGLELDRPIKSLSKGNRQKVGLVQALMGDPELLVLDEPTSGLDPLVQQVVQGELRRAATEGRTVFLSSHVLSEVSEVADRVGLIRDGRLVAVEEVEQLRARSTHLVEATLAKADANALDGIPGVSHRAVDGREVRLEVTGPIGPVVQALAAVDLEDLAVREQTLEELFLAFYEGTHDDA